jgi:hypothetical protein
VGESSENRDWDMILAGSLRRKLRSEGMRTDFIGRRVAGDAPQPAPEAAPGPMGGALSATPPPGLDPARVEFIQPPMSAPAGGGGTAIASGHGVTSAAMVVARLRRSLGPRDEQRALDILAGRAGRGGRGGWGATVAVGLVAVLLSGGTAFVLGRRPGDGGALKLASAIEPPREAPFPGAGPNVATRVAPAAAGPDTPTVAAAPAMPDRAAVVTTADEAGPVFRVGRASAETEWVDLGGKLVDLDRFPPRTSAGPRAGP